MRSTRLLIVISLIFLLGLLPGRSQAQDGGVAKKRKVILKAYDLLKMPGGDQPELYKSCNPWPGVSTPGFDLKIPGTDAKICSFSTRTDGTQWHVGVFVNKKKLSPALVSRLTHRFADLVGTPELETLLLVVSEGPGKVVLKDMPQWFSQPLQFFEDTDKLFRPRGTVEMKKGVNFFATFRPPAKGPLYGLERIVLAGGKVTGETFGMQGCVGVDILGMVINKIKGGPQTEEVKAPDGSPVERLALKIMLPEAVPAPFAFMEEKTASRIFYTKYGPTALWFELDDKENRVTVGGGRLIHQTLLGKRIDLENNLQIEVTRQGGELGFEVVSKGSATLPAPVPLFPGGLFKLRSIHMNANLSDLYRSQAAAKEGEHAGHQGKLKLAVGGAADFAHLKNLDVTFTVGVAAGKGEGLELTDLGFSLNTDLSLGDLPLVKEIPVVNALHLEEATVGLSLTENELPDPYLAGSVKIFGFRGEAALSFQAGQGTPKALFAARITNFTVNQILESAKIPIPGKLRDTINAIFQHFTLPQAALLFSNTDPETAKHPLLLKDLPGRMQQLFDGMVDETRGKIPIYADGLTILGTFDVSAINELIQLDAMKMVFENFGVGDAMKKMGVDGPLKVAGSVGGLASGGLKLGLYVDMPTFNFPQPLKPFDSVINLDQGTQSFFIRTDFNDGGSLQAGVHGDISFAMPQMDDKDKKDEVTLGGEVFVNIDELAWGVRMAGFKTGDWNNPLGLGNVVLKNVAMMIGFDSNRSIELGCGGAWSIKIPDGGTFSSPLTALASPNEALGHLKDLRDGKTADRMKTLYEKGTGDQHADQGDMGFGFGGMVALSYFGDCFIPTKMALYMQQDRLGILEFLDMYDAMLRGVLSGPAAVGILHHFKDLLDGTSYAVLEKLQNVYQNSPSFSRLFCLDKLPLGLFTYRDLLVYFATPGATLPGFPQIDGIGLKMRGECDFQFFGTHKLVRHDYEFTLKNGIKMHSEGPEIVCDPLFALKNTMIDIRAGIPGLHGGDIPSFTLTGSLSVGPKGWFINHTTEGTVAIGIAGIDLEFVDELSPFGKAEFEFNSYANEGDGKGEKKLGLEFYSDPTNLTRLDFSIKAAFQNTDIVAALKSEIEKYLIHDCNRLYEEIAHGIEKKKAELTGLKKEILAEREKAKMRCAAVQSAQASAFGELKRQRDRALGKIGKIAGKIGLGFIVQKLESLLDELDRQIARLEKTTHINDFKDNVFRIAVQADPAVAALELKYGLKYAGVMAAVKLMQGAKFFRDQGQGVLKGLIQSKLFQQPVVIRRFELSGNSLRNGNLMLHIDMTLCGTVLKCDLPVDPYKGLEDIVPRLVDEVIPGAGGNAATAMKFIRDQMSIHGEKTAGEVVNHNDFLLPDSQGQTVLSPLEIQKLPQINTRNVQPVLPGGEATCFAAYLLDLDKVPKGHWTPQGHAPTEYPTEADQFFEQYPKMGGHLRFWVMESPAWIAVRNYPMPFIIVDHNGKGFNHFDWISILTPTNRYVTTDFIRQLKVTRDRTKATANEKLKVYGRTPEGKWLEKGPVMAFGDRPGAVSGGGIFLKTIRSSGDWDYFVNRTKDSMVQAELEQNHVRNDDGNPGNIQVIMLTAPKKCSDITRSGGDVWQVMMSELVDSRYYQWVTTHGPFKSIDDNAGPVGRVNFGLEKDGGFDFGLELGP